MVESIRLLSKSEQLALREGDKKLQQIIESVVPGHRFKAQPADIRILQEVVDSHFVKPRQTYEMESLGYGLGRVLASMTNMKWAHIRNEAGSAIALVDPATGFVLYPMRMILKRTNAGRHVDIHRLVRDCVRKHRNLRNEKMQRTKRPPSPR